ncbi:MAG: 30S ribosomal protein S16 [Candidatus Roizmanbacteria bacterium]|nr:30S ribosomal protein S16 [Candidatus Roizmanbacteria bacterium]
MSATIRLMKFGKRRRDGSYLEKVGTYNPHTEPATLIIDDVKLQDWLKKGAQVSEGMRRLLKNRKTK